ncbi:MAG: ATP phosphoribosyltransferase regulatory subunit [Alphaproteobacteria bacterium]
MRAAAKYNLDEASRAKLEGICAAIMQRFVSGAYERIDLPVLQPADLYLDMAGEDIRERMFVFDDPMGNELCLRADLTIPLCRFVLDHKERFPARHSCLGSVFRFDVGTSGATEMLQAGIECLGGPPGIAGDIEVLELACAALAAAGMSATLLTLGDVSLFPALLADLGLDEIWQRRFGYAFRHPSLLQPTLADMRAGRRPKARTFPIDFARVAQSEAEAFVSQRVGLADGEEVSGRSAADIAARLVDRAKAAAAPLPDAKSLDVIEAFLAIEGVADQAILRLKSLAAGARFAKALARLEECAHRARTHQAADDVMISTTLGRSFVYYTGFVFSLSAPGESEPLAAGGRYDRLLSDLGAREPKAAVGCAIWPERILAAQGAPNG